MSATKIEELMPSVFTKARFGIDEDWLEANEMVDFLVTDWRDYFFLEKNVLNGESILNSLIDLRKKKIEELNITKNNFVNMYYDDPKNALEMLFQHKITSIHLNIIKEKGFTPEWIYDNHKKDPLKRLGRIIL